MTMIESSGGGQFATARRGGVTVEDVRDARAAIGRRATSSMVASWLGRSVADVRAVEGALPPPIIAVRVQPQVRPHKPVRLTLAERDEMIRDLHSQGLFFKQIAGRVGMTAKATGFRAGQLGLKPHRREVCPDELRKLHADGLTYQQIADQLGITVASVRHRMTALGLSRRQLSRWSPEDAALACELRAEGKSIQEIMARCGRTKGSVLSVLHRSRAA